MSRYALLFLLLLALFPKECPALDDARALNGFASAPVISDLRTDKPEALAFMLGVIADTRESMTTQGVGREVVVSMHGPTVRMLVKGGRVGSAETQAKIAVGIAALAADGVRLEACGYALKLLALDPEDLLKGVSAVENSLISLAGYPQRGYALIPMN